MGRRTRTDVYKRQFKHRNKNALLGRMLFHWEARAVMFIVLIWLLVWEIFLIMELANIKKTAMDVYPKLLSVP